MPDTEMAGLRLGLCGWNGSQRAYFADFDCIEIQSTFYDPPTLTVARKWRAAAPPGFAVLHQGLAADHSHGRQSHLPAFAVPDSRRTSGIRWVHSARRTRSGRPGNARLKSRGLWKRGSSCSSARSRSSRRAKISSICRRFSAGWKEDSFRLAWEPRGEAWTEDVVRELCAEYDLIHCVDPFEAVSVHGDMRYWRLHGRGSYSYRYTDADLAALRHMLTKSPQPGYLMFNNFSSKADALRFRQLF